MAASNPPWVTVPRTSLETMQPGQLDPQQQHTRPADSNFPAQNLPPISAIRQAFAPNGGSYDQAWQPPVIDLTTSSSLLPTNKIWSSGGSDSSGGAGRTYAGSSGYSIGSSPTTQQLPTIEPDGRPGRSRYDERGNATRYQHGYSQCEDGLLAPRPNKRQRQMAEEEDGSEREGDRGGHPRPGTSEGQGAVKRLPISCSHCRRLKMKCVFGADPNVCQRCANTNKTCVVEEIRKQRRGPNKRELFMRELAEKDRIIDYLLRQHDGPKANLDVTLQSAQAPVSNDIVTSLMTLAEVISCLSAHGCINITGQLNKESCSQYSICNGGFGDVFLGKLKGGSQVAIKTMRYSVGSESENRKSLKHAALELYTWSKCRHPNVHPLLGLVEFRNQIGMVSTWEVNGNLSEHIRLRPTVDRCLLSAQIATGLSYLHDSGVIHGDLKACNVLVSKDGVPMLADFGNATLQVHTLKFTTTSTKLAISSRWAAPEVLEGEVTHSIPADIYALGMTILETITGALPWFGKSDPAVMAAVMVKKSHPERPLKHIPNECGHGDTLWSMLRKCWTYSPGDRPSAAEVQDIMRGVTDKGLNLLAKHTQNGTMLSSPSAPSPKGSSGAGTSGSKNAKPAENTRPAGSLVNGSASKTSAASNTSARVTGAGTGHGPPRAELLELGSEADAARDQVPSPPRPHPIQDPPIDIRSPTTDQSMHKAAQSGKLIGLLDAGRQSSNTGQNQIAMGSYVTIEPSDRSSIASTLKGDTDITAFDLDYEDQHDMLAAIYALQDQSWLDNCLLPGFNANFADDGSNSSGGMRWMGMDPGPMLQGAGTG